MRLLFRGMVVLLAGLALAGGGVAQTSSSKASAGASAPAKRFCQTDGGFCFSYPASWTVVGEAFDNGVIVAPQQKAERALWDVVTVAMVVPAPAENQSARSADDVISTAMGNMRSDGRDPQTLERQQRTVDGLPAQMIRLHYHDDEGRDWIEELVFIAGPEQEIYSVALKAQPATIPRIEPAFGSILRSWKLRTSPTTSPAPAAASPGTGASGSPADPSAASPNPKN